MASIVDTQATSTGLYELCHVCENLQAFEGQRKYWALFGYMKKKTGTLPEAECEKIYGIRSPLVSLRLAHKSNTDCSMIRLMCFTDQRHSIGYVRTSKMASLKEPRNILALRSTIISSGVACNSPTSISKNEFNEESFTFSALDGSFTIVVGGDAAAGKMPGGPLSPSGSRKRSSSAAPNLVSATDDAPIPSPVLKPAKAFLQSPKLLGQTVSQEDEEEIYKNNFFL
jgi:hypothetical protein|eukprot:g7565.t1